MYGPNYCEEAYPENPGYNPELVMEPQVERLVKLAHENGRSRSHLIQLDKENRDLKSRLADTEDDLARAKRYRDSYLADLADARETIAKLEKKIPKKPKKVVKKGKK